MAAHDILEYLKHNNVTFEVRHHVPAYSPAAHAAANHVSEREVVQTHVVEADGEYWMAVYPGNMRLDPAAFRGVLNAGDVRRLEEQELVEIFPDSEIDAAPPFGNLYGVGVVADASLELAGRIVFKGCSHAVSFTILWPAYRRLVSPRIARFTRPTRLPEKLET